MSDRRCPGDRQHDRGALQQPGKSHLCRSRTVRGGNATEAAPPAGKRPTGKRHPGDKDKLLALAEREDIVPGAVAQAVAVLHGDDRGYRPRSRQLLEADVADADLAHLALCLQLGQRADRLFERDLRINGMQVVELDPL